MTDDLAREKWRDKFVPMSEVSAEPPRWVLPGLLVPGLNLLVGPPKSFKSFMVLKMIAAIASKKAIGNPAEGRIGKRKGPIAYFAKEQSKSRLKYIYESRVLKKMIPKSPVTWDFIVPKNTWRWKADSPESGYDLEEFIADWKPMICVLDPYIYFHSLDENDPHLIDPLIPLREAMLKWEGALVVVHHTRKEGNDKNGRTDNGDWNKIRGTSALFGMADSATMLARTSTGALSVVSEFKDFPSTKFTMRIE